MKMINLKKSYPSCYKQDVWIEISEEVFDVIEVDRKKDKAYKRKRDRYKAYYSFQRGEGIENDVVLKTPKPDEIYAKYISDGQMSDALKRLSLKCANRICLNTIFGMTFTAIAKLEKVDESSIRESIAGGLKRLREYLKEN